jgi:predicted phosphodiesterase
VEIIPFFDTHIGKANCNEIAIRKQVQEILRREEMRDRHIRVLLGGDICNAISSNDRKRFDFSDVADWIVSGPADKIKDALADTPNREIKRIKSIFDPIKHLIIGALEGNHEESLRKYHNMDVQERLCESLECENLSDEALIRFRFKRPAATSTMVIYMRHGYGAGRSIGAEPSKLEAMLAEWECADVCMSGHTHNFFKLPPKPVAEIPHRGKLPSGLIWRYRYAFNPGCWLDSHSMGRGTYESKACYPARPFMTAKIVVWPFYTPYMDGREFSSPKIEIRDYSIL